MKQLIAKTAMLLALSAALFSFTANPGGEGYEVFVNGKVVVQKFGREMDKPHIIRFAVGTENDEITVKYHHCGRVGKNRVLTVKDEQDNVLKQIRFEDSNNPVAGMSCRVSDIISLRKGNSNALKLYYSSAELPDGRLLVSIVNSSASVQP